MGKRNYKEEQQAQKKRMGTASLFKPKGPQGTMIIDGTIYQKTLKGLRKVGFLINGKGHELPPEPLNKKERRKLRAGKPFLDKKRKLIKPEGGGGHEQ